MQTGLTTRVSIYLSAALAVLSITAGCGSTGEVTDELAPAGGPQDLTAQGGESPAGLDGELWAELTAELERVIAEQAKHTSAAPLGAGSGVCDFGAYYIDFGMEFSWTYRQQGDYDLNGSVTIADLSRVGIHFGKHTLSSDWQQAQLADGNCDGLVSIADVTPLGQNFGGRLDGYELQSHLGDEDWAHGLQFAYAGGDPASGKYSEFTHETTYMVGTQFYRVVPYAEENGELVYGTPSNVWTTGTPGHWGSQRGNIQHDGLSTVFGPQDCGAIWTLPLTGSNIFSEPISDRTDTIYVGTFTGPFMDDSGGYFHAARFDGSLKWRLRTASGIAATAAVSPQGRIIFGDLGGKVYAIAPDGKLYWTRNLPQSIIGCGPLVDGAGNVYLLASTIGTHYIDATTLYKLNADGDIEWSYPLVHPSMVAPFFDGQGNIAVVDENGQYYQITAGGALIDGGLLVEEPASGFPSRIAAQRGGSMITALQNEHLAVVPLGGGPSSSVALDGYASSAVALNSAGRMILGSSDGAQSPSLQLNMYDGALQEWKLSLPGNTMSAIAIDSADQMYFSTYRFVTEIGEIEDSIGEWTINPGVISELKQMSAVPENGVFCVGPDKQIEWFYPTGEQWAHTVSIAADDLLVIATVGDRKESLFEGADTALLGIRTQ